MNVRLSRGSDVEVVEYAATREEAERAAHAVEINCGGVVEVRPAADGYGWEVCR